jgi:hypothetical protein
MTYEEKYPTLDHVPLHYTPKKNNSPAHAIKVVTESGEIVEYYSGKTVATTRRG